MRVHELAKELGTTSKELLDKLAEKKVPAKNHMSNLDQLVVDLFLKKAKSDSPAKSAPSAKKVPAAKPLPPRRPPLEQTAPKPEQKPAAQPKARIEKKSAPAAVAVQKDKPVPKNVKVTIIQPPPKPAAPEAKKPEPIVKSETTVKQVEKEIKPAQPVKPEKVIEIYAPVTVGDLAQAFGTPPAQLIKSLMVLGIFANINQAVNEQVVKRVADAMNLRVQLKNAEEETKKQTAQEESRPEDLVLRNPVVTMMGHVDHGKTSLLDAIRKSNVADHEVGRITQHVGAYEVRRGGDKFITFLDTPGHAAFSAMRARGAMVTDVVVLVVGADDGVMPQTIEAIDHARDAAVPIVVAINKTDLPSANPDRVRQQLQKNDLVPEDWGGKTIMVPVSARTGKGLDNLLESLLLEAEILELKANPKARARGIVLEGRMSQGEGPTSTVIVQNGTLRVGDPVVCGCYYGKVRALRNNINTRLKEAVPAQAVEVIGLNGVPEAADEFHVERSLSEARSIAEKRQLEVRERQRGVGHQKHLTLDDLHMRIAEGKIKELKLVLKTDVQGSLEVLTQQLEKLTLKEVRLHVIHGGTGPINDSDVVLAAASDAVVIGFHVRAGGPHVEELIEKEGVDVRYYNIIYDAVNDITKAIEGMLEPTYKEVITGRCEVRKIFRSSKVGTIAGAYVVKGSIARTNRVRVFHSNNMIYEGKLNALKRFKDDVKEVKEGFECGMSFENFNEIHEHDIVQSYALEKVAARIA
ncbi:MAG: translation initiation factor IF-2 [Candidatus Omnitrophica bacterium]|nr:translation initiation factor IF-2 [Candidatus Omnitrophota bacterium]